MLNNQASNQPNFFGPTYLYRCRLDIPEKVMWLNFWNCHIETLLIPRVNGMFASTIISFVGILMDLLMYMDPVYWPRLNRFVKERIAEYKKWDDYSDVGDKLMLMTWSWWRFVDVGDWISMLVTSYECWCPKLMWKDGCWWPKWLEPSPTSYS